MTHTQRHYSLIKTLYIKRKICFTNLSYINSKNMNPCKTSLCFDVTDVFISKSNVHQKTGALSFQRRAKHIYTSLLFLKLIEKETETKTLESLTVLANSLTGIRFHKTSSRDLNTETSLKKTGQKNAHTVMRYFDVYSLYFYTDTLCGDFRKLCFVSVFLFLFFHVWFSVFF